MAVGEEFDGLDTRILGLMDIGDRKGIRLELKTVIRIIRSGIELEDLTDGITTEVRKKIGLNAVTRAQLNLLIRKEADADDWASLRQDSSLYLLSLYNGALTEEIIRNTLVPSGIRLRDIGYMSYETFKDSLGGAERVRLFKIMKETFVKCAKRRNFLIVEPTDVGEKKTVPAEAPVVVKEEAQIRTTPSEESIRLEKQNADFLLTYVYDDMEDAESLEAWLNESTLSAEELKSALSRLEKMKYVAIENQIIKKVTRTLAAFVRNQKEGNAKLLLIDRLGGMSMSDLGKKYDIQGIMINRIVGKIFAKIPITHIDEARTYSPLFKKYDVDVAYFTKVLAEEVGIYYFLNEKCTKGKEDKFESHPLLSFKQKKNLLSNQTNRLSSDSSHVHSERSKEKERDLIVEKFMTGVLFEDVHLEADLVRQNRSIQDFRYKYLNERSLKEKGYVRDGRFLVRREIGTVDKYFKTYLLKNDYFQSDYSGVQETREFKKVIIRLQNNLELLRIEDNLYMNISVFERNGVTRDELREFLNLVADMFEEEKYYTVKNLQNHFSHKVFDLGFDEIFYERLWRTHPKIRYIALNGKDIFYQGSRKRALVDFINDQIVDDIELDDFLSIVQEKYGISLEPRTVIEKVRTSGLYYVPETRKIYIDKEKFFDDLYDNEK